MKVSGSPPIYCFLMLNCLDLIAQFNKLLPRTLKNSDRLLKTKRKEKTTDSRPIQNASEISRSGQTFLRRASVFRGTILLKIPLLSRSAVAQLRFDLLQKARCTKITVLLCEQAAIRNDFRASVLTQCIDIRLQGKSR